MKYIVPEYYNYFQCKCGECRNSCCGGWPVRISMKEYYHLLGIDCSDKLRAKIDCALKICSHPSNEAYAQIVTNWLGSCMLQNEDGLCALHMELGESSMPEVCQLYPRSAKQITESCEISCSNSCEKVVESLMNLKGSLQFEEKDISIHPKFLINLSPNKYEYSKKSISIIQDRYLSLPERFISLGNFLYGTELYSSKPDNISIAFQVLNVYNKYFQSSISISEYCKEALSYFDIEDKDILTEEDLDSIAIKHSLASQHLEAILPDWQILFEQLILNHMFYNNFPYIDNQEKVNDAFLSLTIIYSFLRFNILGNIPNNITTEKLVDFLAAMFRLIEHSNFKYIAVNLFKKEKFQLENCVPQLLYI